MTTRCSGAAAALLRRCCLCCLEWNEGWFFTHAKYYSSASVKREGSYSTWQPPSHQPAACAANGLVASSSPPRRLLLASSSSPPRRLRLVSSSSPPRLLLASSSPPPRLLLASACSRMQRSNTLSPRGDPLLRNNPGARASSSPNASHVHAATTRHETDKPPQSLSCGGAPARALACGWFVAFVHGNANRNPTTNGGARHGKADGGALEAASLFCLRTPPLGVFDLGNTGTRAFFFADFLVALSR